MYLSSALASFLHIVTDIESRNQEWRESIQEKWESSKKLPRKKKKKVRKSLLLEWSIANWSPFDTSNL